MPWNAPCMPWNASCIDVFTCMIYTASTRGMICKDEWNLDLLVVCCENYPRRRVGDCADTWYERIQPTETWSCSWGCLATDLPMCLHCVNRNCLPPATNGLTVLLFCDIHIDKGTTLNILQYFYTDQQCGNWLCSYCHNTINSGSPPVFHECTSNYYGQMVQHSTALWQTTVLAAQKVEEHLSYCFWEEHGNSGQFCKGPRCACNSPNWVRQEPEL